MPDEILVLGGGIFFIEISVLLAIKGQWHYFVCTAVLTKYIFMVRVGNGLSGVVLPPQFCH